MSKLSSQDELVAKGGATWGPDDRYYAARSIPANRDGRRGATETEKRLAKILKKYDVELRKRVERTYKQWNNVVRDCLRNETALRLSVGDDTRSVPVSVVDGLPRPFELAIEDSVGEAWLLLNRRLIERTARGLKLIDERYGELTNWEPFRPPPARHDEVRHVHDYAKRLAEFVEALDLLEKIRQINEDVLGAYFFRLPKVELYWMVIGLMAGTLGVSAEALTIVVLAHELAHAYTHLGRDIDGQRWETESFAGAELKTVEGLAQFYTEVVCEKLEHRVPAAKTAFERLLEIQSEPYKVHRDWPKPNKGGQIGEAGGEIVRVAMVQARARGVTKYEAFELVLDEQTRQLTGRKRRPLPSPAGGSL